MWTTSRTLARRLANALLFARVLLFAISVPLLMRLKLSHLSAVLTPRSVDPFLARREVTTLAWYVDLAVRRGAPITRQSCLTRGVTLYYFLARAGVNVRLCFGMGLVKDAYTGHCWLVKDGEPYLEPTDPRPFFREMYVIPTAEAQFGA